METSSEDIIQPLGTISSDLSEFEDNQQIHKLAGQNVKDNMNLSITTSRRIVCISNTDEGSSDNLKSHTSIDENTIQFSVALLNESSLYKDVATSADQKKPNEKLFPHKENTSRKRKRNPENWKRNKAALLREKGESYRSYSGKDIPKKTPNLGNLCNESCPFQCNMKFSKEQREKLFANFYELDVNSKNALLLNCISKVNVHRRRKDAKKHKTSSFSYMVKTESETVRVCKTALSSVFCIGRGKIDHIQKLIKTGHSVPPLDGRGKHMSRPNKITSDVVSYVEDHIRNLQSEESHHLRTENIHKKHSSPLLSVKKMYDLYLNEVTAKNQPEKFKISEITYRNILSKFRLSFGHPQSDICEKSDIDDVHANNYNYAFEMLKFD